MISAGNLFSKVTKACGWVAASLGHIQDKDEAIATVRQKQLDATAAAAADYDVITALAWDR